MNQYQPRFARGANWSPELQPFATYEGGPGADTYVGTADPDTASGFGGDDNLSGGGGNDVLNGGADNDTLNGDGDNDTLDGGTGTDTVNGGAGLDTLVIDWRNTGGGISMPTPPTLNVVLGGYDGSFSSGAGTVTYTSIERFVITGTSGVDNVVTGDGDDQYTQIGQDSAFYFRDEIDLGAGNDRLVVDLTVGTVGPLLVNPNADGSGEIFFAGNGKLGFTNVETFTAIGSNQGDTLRGLGGSDVFYGNRGADLIESRGGADRLDGGAGGDTMLGGAGDDTYFVDQGGDQTIELDGQGTDIVFSSGLSFTLGFGVENLFAALPANAALVSNETLVNTSVTGASQSPNSIAALPDGGYVITWWDQNGGADARARVFNADGTARSGEILVPTDTAGAQDFVRVTPTATGGFLIAYFDSNGSGGGQVLGRLYDAAGAPTGGTAIVLADTTGAVDTFPAIQLLGTGQIALAWQNNAGDGGGTGISLRLLNPDGSVGAAPVFANTTTAGDQLEPVITQLDDGHFVVAWESRELSGDVIRARIFAADGTPAADDFTVSTQGGNLQRTAITAVEGGGFAVTWEDPASVVGRVFAADGSAIGPQFAVSSLGGSSELSSVTRLPEGGFMAAWATAGGHDGSGFAVLGRIFNADGTPRGRDFVVNQVTDSFQIHPQITTLANGNVAVTFGSEAFHAGDYDVKTLIFDTTPGQALIGNGLANRIIGGFGDDVVTGSGGNDMLTGNQGNDTIYGGEIGTTGPNLVVNGGFETQDGVNNTRAWINAAPEGTFQGVAYKGTTTLFGWERGNGQPIELNTQAGNTQFVPIEGESNVNLNYADNNIIYQDISGLSAGNAYILRFAASQFQVSAATTAQLEVYWNGALVATITPAGKEHAFYSVALTAADVGSGAGGANRLEFREVAPGGDTIGTTLDAVSLHATTAGADNGEAVAAGASPNLLINGSFEQYDAGTSARDYVLASPSTDYNGGEPAYRVSSTLFGWNFLAGTSQIEFETDGSAPSDAFQTADGTVLLDMEVGAGENAAIYQDVSGLAAGALYRIDLSAALGVGPGQTASLNVFWNGKLVGTVAPASTTFSTYVFDVVAEAAGTGAGGANRLTLQESGANDGIGRGTALDNVHLSLVSTPAPSSSDTVDYSAETGSGNVTVDLTAGTATDTFGDADKLSGIENVRTGAGNDTITGNGSANIINAGTGVDRMEGLGGDDIYFVDASADTVIEGAGGGNDRVFAGVSWSLGSGQQVEKVTTIDNLATTAISLTGNGLAQQLWGNAGANVLDGLGGGDQMYGLGGDDQYYVRNGSDAVREFENGGDDRVFAAVSWTLGSGQHVEKLTTIDNLGTTAINLTGNALANAIYGNAGANILDGGGGGDQLFGLGGNDQYYVRNAADTVSEGAGGGNDRVFAGVSWTLGTGEQVEKLTTIDNLATTAINLTGNGLSQQLWGNAGANVLDGVSGGDQLFGMGGDDQYYVRNAADSVTEGAGGGDDRVFAAVSWALEAGQHVEKLTTVDNLATTTINLTGNALANAIYGNAGANILDGGGGGDQLFGLGGGDQYYVRNAADAIFEGAGGGDDRVFAGVSWTLTAGQEVERVTTVDNLATTAINLTGNELGQTIFGNDGANILDGKGGSDTLVGLGGADIFAFTTALGSGNVDEISGFSAADDTIWLENAVFTGLGAGALGAGAFATGSAATEADDRIIYNATTGALMFDVDGVGGTAAVQFASLAPGLALTGADFFVI